MSSSPSPSSSSSELRSALAGAPAPVLETALSLLEASAPLIEGPEAAAAGAVSAEDRKIWLAAVARLAIRVVAVLEGARGVEIDCEEQRTAAAFEEGRKASPAQQLPLTLSALLAALDVRYAVFDRNRRQRARHLCGLDLAWGWGRERSQKEKRSKEEKKRGGSSKVRPSLSLESFPPPLLSSAALGQKRETNRRALKNLGFS